LAVEEIVGQSNRVSDLAIGATGKRWGKYRRIGMLVANDTRPVFDTRIKYQDTSHDEQGEADSLLYERLGDGDYTINLV
jgi:hypothetical protein